MRIDFKIKNKMDQLLLLAKSIYQKNSDVLFIDEKKFTDWVISKYHHSSSPITDIEKMISQEISNLKINVIQNNHNTYYSFLRKLIENLQKEEIDFYLDGNISIYSNQEDLDKHLRKTISICLRESDFSKFQFICNHMGYSYKEQFEQKLDHSFIVNYCFSSDQSFIEILVSTFESLVDGTTIFKRNYQVGGNQFMKEEILSSNLSSKIFDQRTVSFQGIDVNCISSEYLLSIFKEDYSLLNWIDYSLLKEMSNPSIVHEIKDILNTDRSTQITPVIDVSNEVIQQDVPISQEETKISKRQLMKLFPSKTGSISFLAILLITLSFIVIGLIGVLIFLIMKG